MGLATILILLSIGVAVLFILIGYFELFDKPSNENEPMSFPEADVIARENTEAFRKLILQTLECSGKKIFVDFFPNASSATTVIHTLQVRSEGGFLSKKFFNIFIEYTDLKKPIYTLQNYRGNDGLTCDELSKDILIQKIQTFINLWK